MSKDKTVLVLLLIIAVASFCGGMLFWIELKKEVCFRGGRRGSI